LFSGFRISSVVVVAANNKEQSEMHATMLGHASITTRMTTSILILTILTLTQQSTTLHNGKV
jgi:energy-coupling factor transporter transmembrane protein EcfT